MPILGPTIEKMLNCSHIDLFIISEDWEDQFPYLAQNCVPPPLSDHCPTMIDMAGPMRGHLLLELKNCGFSIKISSIRLEIGGNSARSKGGWLSLPAKAKIHQKQTEEMESGNFHSYRELKT